MINELQFRPSSGSAKGLTFTIWDIGGQEKLRPLWRTYIRQADAVIFVVDSSDHERFEEARIEFANLVQMPDFPRNVPIILLANKQDLPDAHSRNDIQQLIISEFTSKILSHILPCCAITGEGLDDIFGVMHRYILEARRSSKKR
ncbi:unnamed protein product [Dracunculus medinensis]|uniref:ADP-ribosylation factor n=1 Tax=Dracunculus medinensis TaxID=318479 RepID=A0A0N4UHN0_DRAME|nr:unnamed protein product [Dracunculus medinensis]